MDRPLVVTDSSDSVVDVIGEFVFGDGFFSAPFAIGEQLIDVLLCVAKRLIGLLWEPVGDVLRER